MWEIVLLTCNKFECNGKFFECPELTPLDADDSLDNNETVSLNAESLSGLSVRGSRNAPLSDPLPVPLSDDVDIDEMVEFVTCESVELERLCDRPNRGSTMLTVPIIVPVPCIPVAIPPFVPRTLHAFRVFGPFFCSSILSSPRMASSSDSCVSSRLAIENR